MQRSREFTRPSGSRARYTRDRSRLLLLACYALAGFAWWSMMGCGEVDNPPFGFVSATSEDPEVAVSYECSRKDFPDPEDDEYFHASDVCPTPDTLYRVNEKYGYGICITAEPAALFDAWDRACDCLSDPDEINDAFAGCTAANECARWVYSGGATCAAIPCTDPFGLEIEIQGEGSAGIESTSKTCTAGTCIFDYCAETPAATVDLWVEEPVGSSFIGWEGDPDCADGSVVMDGDRHCVAVFRRPILTVSVVGSGRVRGLNTALDCGSGSVCTVEVSRGRRVELQALPDGNANLLSWQGDCAPIGSFYMDGNMSCTATFSIASLAIVGVEGIVTLADNESPGNESSFTFHEQAGSSDLSVVAFRSFATNLTGPAPEAVGLDYVRNRTAGTTRRVGPAAPSGFNPRRISVSADGAFLAYEHAPAPGQDNQVYWVDLRTGREELVSIYDNANVVGYPDEWGFQPAISGNGRYVAYLTGVGYELEEGAAVHDTCSGAAPEENCTPHSVAVSLDSNGEFLFMDGFSRAQPRISRDGRFVLFVAYLPDFSGQAYFRRDRDADGDGIFDEPGDSVTIVANPDPGGDNLDYSWEYRYDLDASGRYLALESRDTDLPDNNPAPYLNSYRYDTCTGGPVGCVPGYTLLSVRSDGLPFAGVGTQLRLEDFSASGRFVALYGYDALMVSSNPAAFANNHFALVRDTCLGATPPCIPGNRLLSRRTNGTFIAYTGEPRISDDGTRAILSGPRSLTSGSVGDPGVFDTLAVATGVLRDPGAVPIANALAPVSVPAGSPELLLTITGNGFVPGARVLWAGQPRNAIYVSPRKLQVRVDADDLLTPGAVQMRVVNPGGDQSGIFVFVKL